MEKLRFIFGLMILFISFTGCERDEFENIIDIEEGLPAVIRLEYGSNVGNIDISTKAGLSGEQEDAIYSIYVMTFDKNGNRTNNSGDALFYRTDDGTGNNDPSTTNYKVWTDESGKGNYSKGYIEFNAQSGTDVKIYAVANVNTKELSGLYSLSSDDLDKVTDLTQLMDLTVGIKNAAVTRGSKLMMFGCYKSDKTSNEPLGVTITGNGTTVQTITSGKIYFERLDAKVEFNVSIATDLAEGVEEFELDLHNWQVFNVPFNAKLAMGKKYGDGLEPKVTDSPDDGEYLTTFNTSASNQFDNGNSFTFYMLESNLAASETLTNYNQREEKNKEENGAYTLTDDNWTWKYAPDKSPYVQIKGRLSYKQNNETSSENKDHIHADVVYNIHLGDFTSNVNDFWTKPNTHYKYKIYVKGVNNITVEVETSNDDKDGITENQSGAEGNVVIASGGNIHEVDAHYAQFLLPFTYNSTFLDAMGGASSIDDLTWYVSTPYSEGTYQEGANNNETKHYDETLLDYKWVEFYISDTETMVTYEKYLEWLKSKGRATLSNGKYTKTNPLYITEFVEELKLWYNYKNGTSQTEPNIINVKEVGVGVEQSIYVTVFVNEFYYENGNPLSATDNDIPAMVRKVVNGEDRYMHILSNVQYSADGSSSVTNSAATIIQKPIRSIYNIPDFGLLSDYNLIWGTETISEKYGAEKDFGFLYGAIDESKSSANSTYNGRHNTYILWENQLWSERMTIDNNVWTMMNATTPSANPAVYACLARNRDENGNNQIDTEEIKWYLAAIDQLQYLYLGENVIHPDAKLLPSWVTHEDANKYKYLSSTYTSSHNGGGWVLWAEEGLSTSGNLNGWTEDPYSESDKNRNYVRRPVRCLRNLGIDDNMGNGVNSLFINNNNVISPTYMNTEALRNDKWMEATLVHEDRTSLNIPYIGGFEYHSTEIQLSKNRGLYNEIEAGGGCPSGYRIPNQRELALMYIAGVRPNGEGYLWASSYSWYKDPYAFIGITHLNTVTVNYGNDGHVWRIRCIKDVDAANPSSIYNDKGSLIN